MKLVPVLCPSDAEIGSALEHLEHACEFTKDWDVAAVMDAILDQTVLLMLCREGEQIIGAGVVSVETDITMHRALVVHLFGADSDTAWEALFEPLQAFAREMGCRALRGWGRAGWARKLGAKAIHGWEVDL